MERNLIRNLLGKFLVVLMWAEAEGQVAADLGARTTIGGSRINKSTI